jgi:hypothetical protein
MNLKHHISLYSGETQEMIAAIEYLEQSCFVISDSIDELGKTIRALQCMPHPEHGVIHDLQVAQNELRERYKARFKSYQRVFEKYEPTIKFEDVGLLIQKHGEVSA